MEPATDTLPTLTNNERALERSPEVKSWDGWFVRRILYGVSASAFALSGYEAVAGGLTSSTTLEGFAKGGDYFAIAVGSAAVGIATLVLGCCTHRYIAEKKLESNVQQLDDLGSLGDSRIRELQLEIEELQGYLKELKDQVAISKETIGNLDALLTKRTYELTTITSDFKSTNIAFEKNLAEHKKAAKVLSQENASLKATAKKVKKENERLQRENDRLHSECDKFKMQVDHFDTENDELRLEMNTLAQEKQAIAAAVVLLKAQIDELTVENNAMKEGKVDLLQKIDQLSSADSQLLEACKKLQDSEQREKELLETLELIVGKFENLTDLSEEFKPLVDAWKGFKSEK